MLDIVLEITRALMMGVILGFTLAAGRRHELCDQRGWQFIVAGFGFLLLGSLLDITDNFESLDQFVVVGDTEVEAILEKIVGYLLGFVLLFVGFWYWLPLVGALKMAEQQLAIHNERLETDVSQRTAELRKANQQLRIENVERKRAEAALARNLEELANSNAELQQFAYVASHDLQELLRKAQAFGDRLSSTYGDRLGEQGLDYLSRMQDAAGRMQTLIQSLLSFSRIGTNAEPHVPVDLDAVVQEVVGDLEVRIQETGAEVEVSDLPTVEADPTQMRQIFQNLIGNALKYRREGVAPAVRVSAEVVDGAAGPANGTPVKLCRIRIEDNGIGFEPQFADRIFGIFQRLHGRGEFEGTGVGLAICRKIAERHGGTISAEGRPGSGSCFTLTLPFDKQERSHG